MKLTVKREGGRISLYLDAGVDAGQSHDEIFAWIFIASLDALQHRVKSWADTRLPERGLTDVCVSLAEEVGELSRAVAKGRQKVRFTPQEIARMKREEAADVLLTLLDFCAVEGFSLAKVALDVFEKKSTPTYDFARAADKRRRDASASMADALSTSLLAMRRGGLTWRDSAVQEALAALCEARGFTREAVVQVVDDALESERKSSAAGKAEDAL